MEKKKLSRINLILKILFFTILALYLVYMVLGEVSLPKEQFIKQPKLKTYKENWVQVFSNGREHRFTPPEKLEADSNGLVTIETILMHEAQDNNYLVLSCRCQDVIAMVGEEERVHYSTKDTRLWGTTSAKYRLMIPLKEEDQGKKLTIQYTGPRSYVGIVSNISYGDRMSVWEHELKRQGIEIVAAWILLLFGAVLVVLSIILKIVYRRTISLEYLSWGVILSAVWMLSNSAIKQLIFPNISVVSDFSFLTVLVIPIPFIFYVNELQAYRYEKIYLSLVAASILNAIISIILQVLNVKDLRNMFHLSATIFIVSVLFILGTICYDIAKKRILSYLAAAIGFGGSVSFGAMQVVMYLRKSSDFSIKYAAIGLIYLIIVSSFSTAKDLMQIEQDKQNALMASKSKAAFLANMSHEIRTPINAVLGMNEMILRETNQEIVKSYATDVERSGRMLLSLVNDILDMSKIESGKMELVNTNYQLDDVLHNVATMLLPRAKAKGLEFRVKINEMIPKNLYGDEVRITQILVNLLTNAIKYTESGYIQLEASWVADRADVKPGDVITLILAVRDSGKGIREEDKAVLFENFSRVDQQANRKIEGTGLGLSITSNFIHMMDGALQVDSEYKKGSCFTASVKQVVTDNGILGKIDVFADQSVDSVKEHSTSFEAPNARILVVDDVDMNLKVFTSFLNRTQMQIDTANSGLKALAMYRRKKYDMVFLDHMMPDLDGIETLKAMQKKENQGFNDSHTPIIMLTANAISGMKEKYIKLGFIDYLSKPFRLKDLEHMVIKYLPEELVIQAHIQTKQANEVETVVEENKNQEQTVDLTTQVIVEEKPNKKAFMDMLKSCSELNYETGLTYCAGEESFYKEMIEIYVSSNMIEQLQSDYENEKWKEYQILIHSLKGTSKTIGLLKLSQEALDCENALKEE